MDAPTIAGAFVMVGALVATCGSGPRGAWPMCLCAIKAANITAPT